MDIISALAPLFERYITLERVHPTQRYDYKARGMHGLPVFECTMHRKKCSPGSWTYIAIPGGANPATLASNDRLYIGSQTADRMFRGDGLNARNFHHAQMRAGKGNDTPEAYLRGGQRIDILRIDASGLQGAIAGRPQLSALHKLISSPSPKHPGFWLEQFVLHAEHGQWRWNTNGPVREVAGLVRELG